MKRRFQPKVEELEGIISLSTITPIETAQQPNWFEQLKANFQYWCEQMVNTVSYG